MQGGIRRAGSVLSLAVPCFALAGSEVQCTTQNAEANSGDPGQVDLRGIWPNAVDVLSGVQLRNRQVQRTNRLAIDRAIRLYTMCLAAEATR